MGISEGSGEGRVEMGGNRVAWLAPRAHGTPTIKLWSFDVRSKEHLAASPFFIVELRREATSHLGIA